MLFNYVHLHVCFVVQHLNFHRSRSPNGTLQSPACINLSSHTNLEETCPSVLAEILPVIALQKESNTRFVSNFIMIYFGIYILLTFTRQQLPILTAGHPVMIPKAKYWQNWETRLTSEQSWQFCGPGPQTTMPPVLLQPHLWHMQCARRLQYTSSAMACLSSAANLSLVYWCIIQSFEFGRIDFITSYLQTQGRQ